MGKSKAPVTEFFGNLFGKIEVIFNIIIAFILLIACGYLVYTAAFDFISPSPTPKIIMHVINEVLLALIILEILWTVIKFLKEKKFVVGPFLVIGVIAAIRRLLYIEAQASYEKHLPVEGLYEISTTALVILVMIVAYHISLKSRELEKKIE